jgi:predicted outer membrane repeat protein
MSARLRTARLFALLSLLVAAAEPALAIVTVGPLGSGCRFTKIQDAVNNVLNQERNNPGDVDPFIGVAGDFVYNEAVVIDGSSVSSNYVNPFGEQSGFVQIFGNYDEHCNDVPVGTTAKIGAGGGKSGNSVIEIRGSKPIHVVLNHFILTAANGVVRGGGINFHGTGVLELSNTEITGNSASAGAGISTDGAVPGLTLALHEGMSIHDNTASGAGGGIASTGETFLFATEGSPAIFLNHAGTTGGGISFEGRGSITLGGVQIAGNTARSGGGIHVGATSAMDFTIGDAAFFAGNSAIDDGGAITLSGPVKLAALSSVAPTQIFLNDVVGDTGAGGGVAVFGPAQMRFSGAIFSNSAGYGGGVAAIAGDDSLDDAYVALTRANPFAPVTVSDNSASHAGGGIYARANSTFTTGGDDNIYSTVCASGFVIDRNAAAEGTAIYADSGNGGLLALSWGSFVGLNYGGAITGRLGCPGVMVCAAGVACNEIAGNFRSGGGSGDGSTILVQDHSELLARRLSLRDNQGAHVLRSVEDTFGFDIDTALIADNSVDGELIRLESAELIIRNSTLAHNTIGAAHVIRSAGPITLAGSIVAEATPATFDFAGNNSAAQHTFDFVLTNPGDATMGNSGFVLFGTPLFAGNRDYHLRPFSPGLDVAPAGAAPSRDLDGQLYDFDLPQIGNIQGPRDLGAYERQNIPNCSAPDQVFCNGFN